MSTSQPGCLQAEELARRTEFSLMLRLLAGLPMHDLQSGGESSNTEAGPRRGSKA